MNILKIILVAGLTMATFTTQAQQFVLQFHEKKPHATSKDLIQKWQSETNQKIDFIRGEGTDIWVLKADIKDHVELKQFIKKIEQHAGVKTIDIDQTRKLMPEKNSTL